MIEEKILPVEEMVNYEEFTDRVEILRELDAWVKNIQSMAAPSTALSAPRRSDSGAGIHGEGQLQFGYRLGRLRRAVSRQLSGVFQFIVG